jgi:PAS domain S-box-containing protein
VVAVLSLIAVGWYFLRRMVRPYESLFQVIRHHSGAGAEAAPAGAGGPGDEVAFLAESFKRVIQQLREKERELQEMHRQAQSRADSSEKFARDIFSALHLAVLSLDAGGRFLDGNPALEELLGRKRVALLNLGYAQIFRDAPAVVQMFEGFYGTPQPRAAASLSLPAPDGAERLVSLSISPLSSPQGVFQGAVAVLADITAEQQLRRRLHTQENLVALGEMAAGIAHELKNSLSTISGYAQMLLGNARPGAEQKRAAALVREVEEMARVISDFLEYARPIQLERAALPLDSLIKELVRDAREKNPGVTFQTNLLPVQVRGEEYLLKKALQNLVLNAVQSMDQAAEKRVEIRMESLTRQAARLWITDTGRGMDEKTLARIFTPFFTTRPDGTGMGLAVVQKIITLHEGAIRIHSEPGRGTTVEIDLPGWPAPAAPEPDSP